MSDKLFRKLAIPSNVSTYLSWTLIIITVATTLLIGGVLIFEQTIYFNRLSEKKSNEYIENQKIYVQEIVNNEIEYINTQNDLFKKQINSKIRQNVNQAYSTAEAIYQKFKGIKSDEEIKSLIIGTISSLKFDMEYEEVFITGLDGIGIYYPRRPDFSGKDLRKLKDKNGASVVFEELKLLRNKEEGFLDYEIESSENSENFPHKKTAFVKKFGHFNWYFGSKQYLDDYFPKFRDEIAQKISSVRFRYGGYVFMNNTNGKPIVMDGKVFSGKLNLLSDTIGLRHKTFLQQLKAIDNTDHGGFFCYKWNKINEDNLVEKCSYVKLFKEYNWLIGAGFYLDEINQNIKNQQIELRNDQQKSIALILLILFVLLILETLIIYRFNKSYKSDFERFFNFFYLSQNSFNKLNISEFYFDEFRRAGIAANKMILLREEIESKLIEEQKKAKEADRLKSAFLANMSHEIRTPMNAILGFSELLEDENQDEPDKTLFIKLIRRNGEMLLNLINDIIDISKIEADLLSIRKRTLELNKFLNEINDHYTETLASKKDKNIQFKIISDINPEVSIMTDEIRLRQILDNLIGNAIKFTHSGNLTIHVQLKDGFVHFSVSDTGIGIPASQHASIFERFIQAEQSTKMNFGGTGLGLAISKNLIELLGGKISVNSEPGVGSTFSFYISAH
ncbi:MAG: cache domain-containing protein [Prolixibacteraceae bacterium]|jgi:signal transduction histidine kinase